MKSGDSGGRERTRSLADLLWQSYYRLSILVLLAVIVAVVAVGSAAFVRAQGQDSAERAVLIGGVMLEVAVFVGMMMAGRREYERAQAAIVEPVRSILVVIDELSHGHLEATMADEGPQEMRDIAAGLRSMAAALSGEQAALASQAAELHRARVAAEEANRSKSDFLSRVSHELRTPLTAILGFAELLESDELTELQSEFVSTILKAGEHLLELINDVLDISRIGAGTLTVVREELDPLSVINDTVGVVRPLAEQRHISISVDPADADLRILADRQRLKQVILNLASNAIKYNVDGGAVTLSLSAAGDSVRISVADTGAGISATNLTRLFSPFERLDAGSRGVEGTGLGLALCRSLSEAMGGSLEAESRPGEGSRFTIVLPRALEPSVAAAALELPAVVRDIVVYGAPRRLLYVEDTRSNLHLVERLLERRPDIEVIPAATGAEGIAIAGAGGIDAVLLDLHLPDMDGADVLRAIRDTNPQLPIVVISADATDAQVSRLTRAGARAYITKPIATELLLTTLDQLLVPVKA